MTTIRKLRLREVGRQEGSRTDREARTLGRAIARHFGRFAFPDDLNPSLRGVVERLKEKRGKYSPEGRAVDYLREIRVSAQPSWQADRIQVVLVFLTPPRGPDNPLKDEEWESQIDEWMDRCSPTGVVESVYGLMVHIDEFSAAEYVDTDPLDLEYLSPI